MFPKFHDVFSFHFYTPQLSGIPRQCPEIDPRIILQQILSHQMHILVPLNTRYNHFTPQLHSQNILLSVSHMSEIEYSDHDQEPSS